MHMASLSLVVLLSLSFSIIVRTASIPLPSGYHRYSARNNNLEWKNCSVGLAGRECTQFEVPLDWHNDTAGKGSLAIIRYPATKQPKLGTLFINTGGPGGSGVGDIGASPGDTFMQQTGGNYDLVGWDPRGVGLTTPRTACFQTRAEENTFWNGSIAQPSLFGPEFRGNFTSQTDLDAFYEKVNQTDTLLQRIGEQCLTYSPNTFQYVGTAVTVRDMVAMHDILEGPDEPINFWGMSYGSIVGIYFVNMFPDRVGHVIIDSVADPVLWANRPPHESFGNTFESAEAAFDGFTKECANAGPSKCAIAQQNSTASSVRQWTLDLIDAAYDYRQEVGPSALLSSSIVRGAIFPQLYTPQTWANLSQQLYEIKVALENPASLNITQVKRWLQLPESIDSEAKRYKPRQEPTSNQTRPYNYVYEAVICSDAQDAGDVTTKDVFDNIVSVTRRISPTFGPIGIDRFSRPFCHRWPVRAVERYTGPWNKTLSNPILVIGNEADPVTPYINAKSVADALGSSAVVIEQGGYGHPSLNMPSNCTISAIHKYLIHNELPKKDKFCETSTKLFVNPLVANSTSGVAQ
ncbi:Putative hydrolase Mb2247c OS=Mycobacterium bovis (strain ATCC BAA-935 / AF2122/97) GN=Mb2247c PE=3 SV=1 [Rhizoctonia solani AG-1 IB]|uniref:Putative hydrolase Mb2247c n=1 Tax=Thanatephorus cucumeris (strain AG1-IB / isolate 7/3/14) TaxID=1108050 RepID=A0A0B7FLD2_THACB|nr:Putative hydrolase Mb2247c OS=Mycobacterium bovis (strain ATCC BAA-935 / AF2122/97) GN=Mb2247c PE=3 SV=1 [Rhizoctonia solani AG-1 IB]